jgi:hypothetical protein
LRHLGSEALISANEIFKITPTNVFLVLAIGRVQDNRDRRRAARTAKFERDIKNKEKSDKIATERRALGLDGADDASRTHLDCAISGQEHPLTGLSLNVEVDLVEECDLEQRKSVLDSDESVTETSEEEMML